MTTRPVIDLSMARARRDRAALETLVAAMAERASVGEVLAAVDLQQSLDLEQTRRLLFIACLELARLRATQDERART